MVMNTFVALRYINILSKEEMFKINQTFDQENFQARGVNARAIDLTKLTSKFLNIPKKNHHF